MTPGQFYALAKQSERRQFQDERALGILMAGTHNGPVKKRKGSKELYTWLDFYPHWKETVDRYKATGKKQTQKQMHDHWRLNVVPTINEANRRRQEWRAQRGLPNG